jgi:hypothetical protein
VTPDERAALWKAAHDALFAFVSASQSPNPARRALAVNLFDSYRNYRDDAHLAEFEAAASGSSEGPA